MGPHLRGRPTLWQMTWKHLADTLFRIENITKERGMPGSTTGTREVIHTFNKLPLLLKLEVTGHTGVWAATFSRCPGILPRGVPQGTSDHPPAPGQRSPAKGRGTVSICEPNNYWHPCVTDWGRVEFDAGNLPRLREVVWVGEELWRCAGHRGELRPGRWGRLHSAG